MPAGTATFTGWYSVRKRRSGFSALGLLDAVHLDDRLTEQVLAAVDESRRHADANGNTCVETTFADDAVYVRNNLRPDAGTATFTHEEEWTAFVAGVKDGDYDA